MQDGKLEAAVKLLVEALREEEAAKLPDVEIPTMMFRLVAYRPDGCPSEEFDLDAEEYRHLKAVLAEISSTEGLLAV